MGILNDTAQHTHKTWALARVAQQEAQTACDARERRWRNAQRHGYRTAAVYAEEYERAQQAVDVALASERQARAAMEQAQAALRSVQDARHAQRVAAITQRFGRPDLRFQITRQYDGITCQINALVLDAQGAPVMKSGMWHGEPYEYPEERFGFDATVYGPRHGTVWRNAEAAQDAQTSIELTPATVNWGTLGAMTVADARQLHALHALAIVVADWLDQRGAAWLAEDQAD